jgi:hypothetical protein
MTEILQYQIIMGIQAACLIAAMVIIGRQEAKIKELKAKLPESITKRDIHDRIASLYTGELSLTSLINKYQKIPPHTAYNERTNEVLIVSESGTFTLKEWEKLTQEKGARDD